MKTVFQLIEDNGLTLHGDIEHFAELVRDTEREACANICEEKYYSRGTAMKDNSTGKDKEFYELGKKMFDRLNPPQTEREWVETNNAACKILRQVHDMLALASVPPRKTWVGLTELEKAEITSLKWWDWEDTFDIEGFIKAIEAKLKEKNNG